MTPSKFPPKPPGNLLTGHVLDFRRDPVGFLEQCARDYGDIVRLRFFTLPVYLLSHPAYVEDGAGRLCSDKSVSDPP